MKRTIILLACAFVVVFASLTTVRAAEEGFKQGKATVRSVHGTVEYQADANSPWLPVKVNMKFTAGVTIRTGADGVADISVNGTASAIRMTNATVLQIPTMNYQGSARDGDTTTMLNLESGSVIGNVKKITANSRYEIMSPHGVAGIRGTDFRVEAIPTSDGTFKVSFSSITGVITVSAMVNGVMVTHTLTTGMTWEVGEGKTSQLRADIIQNYQSQIMALVESSVPGATIGTPIVPGQNNNNNNNNNPGGNPTTPPTAYPGGGGTPSSGGTTNAPS